MSDQLQVIPKQSVAPAAPSGGLSLESAWEDIKRGDISSEKLAVMKELLAMDAARKFATAKTALQSEVRGIKAMKSVPNNDGSTRYKYAPYEEIMAQVGPLLQKYGFTVSFSTRYEEGRLVKTCTLQHVGGHKESNEFAVRVGQGPPKATECQADGAAGTYAKRFALCDALNIVVEHDSDARDLGKPVTPEQAFELERRVMETNSDADKFLKFAGATCFGEIMSSRYAELDSFLRRKESKGR